MEKQFNPKGKPMTQDEAENIIQAIKDDIARVFCIYLENNNENI